MNIITFARAIDALMAPRFISADALILDEFDAAAIHRKPARRSRYTMKRPTTKLKL
jgi:hypothetical protein